MKNNTSKFSNIDYDVRTIYKLIFVGWDTKWARLQWGNRDQ